ncbi:pyridoxamine 5'-phosphate oxidase family protein [Streptomyces beihaiensis]|uniref:Pyridoxamine 5'-phosphate oxidase family protein n=1 Tax=Streptomyces beihaiensis TaxID=2984495 RepID=A0ABT3TMX7_9ACTN|nr:pyridoxamine 5'-phosphate oxidase family protein [Streptomyces beihaiensis]MCX3058402.1 pyridoxamine 5'-phosphate oxidase family protein [Streptomyces beihaiensis]
MPRQQHPVDTAPVPAPAPFVPRRVVEMGSAESLRLLAGAPMGRIVFTQRALPAIRPVNHIVDGGDIVLRTHEGAALAAQISQVDADGVVVAYEADDIDPATGLGWSVVATGFCRMVTDADQVARYEARIHPWTDQRLDSVVRITPDLITGVRLTGADG